MTGLRSYPGLPALDGRSAVLVGDLVFLNGSADVHGEHEGRAVLGADGGAHQFRHGVLNAADARADAIRGGNKTRK